MKPTRNNIYYDLAESPWQITVGGITYCFSSLFYMQKFMELHKGNREKLNASLSHRFKITVDVPLLCDLALYHLIEKRGFLIMEEGTGAKICLDNLQFAGGKATVRTSTRKSDALTLSWTGSQERTPE